jgi:rhodanese-related sulfurtransferase
MLMATLVLALCGSLAGARAQGDGENLPRASVEELKELLAKGGAVVVDVRNGEIDKKIKGAAHIPETDLEKRLKELPRDREIVTYCA